MSILAKSFTATGSGTAISAGHKKNVSYSVSGTFVGTVIIERSFDGFSFFQVGAAITAAATGTILTEHPNQGSAQYRFRCTAFTSGTIVTSLMDEKISVPGEKQVLMLGAPRVGATAGFSIPTASNLFRAATCAASSTGATLIINVGSQIPIGSIIKGFYLLGQIESAGGAVSLAANLRSTTAAAADIVDASVASITTLAVTAQTKVSKENAFVDGLQAIVSEDKFFYVLITATTAALTDIDLMGVGIVYQEA